MAELLGSPAVRQIIARTNKNDSDEQSLIDKIESGCKKFDHAGKGYLSAGNLFINKRIEFYLTIISYPSDEYFNVLKLQNGIDIRKDEVSCRISIYESLC
jgi:hypothetical protein